MDDTLARLGVLQDGLITRKQALLALTPDALHHRLGRQWQVLLPGIYLMSRTATTPRQRLRAALLYAGTSAVLSDTSALDALGLPFIPDDGRVRVLVPGEVQRLSREFVVVRRTARMPDAARARDLPIAPVARALCELGLRNPDERGSIAVFAAAVQRRVVTVGELFAEAEAGPARGRPRLLRVIGPVAAGVRSAPESDFRLIVSRSRILPEPLWNPLVELADGRRFSPDALFVDAGLIHETNGREFHAAGDQFEDMQRRNDALVAAGFAVLHNAPKRLIAEADAVLGEVERSYRLHAGRGLPHGVQLVRARGVGQPMSHCLGES